MYVAIRELKAHLSQILAQAQAGEVIEVRSHNKPIARIIGIPPEIEGLPAGLKKLIDEGAVAWGNGGKLQPITPVRLSPGGKSMSDIVIEDRG